MAITGRSDFDQLPRAFTFLPKTMSTPTYPYPRLEDDGFQLAVVDQDSALVLAAALPSDEERFAAQPGDLVKLVFQYRDPDVRENGAIVGSEHMWVRITDYGDGCLVGVLDSSPQHTRLLPSDHSVSFHPKHIVAFWRENLNERVQE
jgi:uncharacterized protein YegJ (DUF2314 family)